MSLSLSVCDNRQSLGCKIHLASTTGRLYPIKNRHADVPICHELSHCISGGNKRDVPHGVQSWYGIIVFDRYYSLDHMSRKQSDSITDEVIQVLLNHLKVLIAIYLHAQENNVGA